MDESVLERARHHSAVRKVSISKLFVSDDIQLQSAIKAGCSHLFTRDLTHFRSTAVAVFPPSSFVQ